MRITNNVILRNSKTNINYNKVNVNDVHNQMSSQKKINRPSDDPVIAVRALRLRSNLSELNQFLNTNIKEADSWIEVTDTSLQNIEKLLNDMHTLCVHAANDTLEQNDRNTILAQLRQNQEQIYAEANADYAGRTIFTGWKTDTTLTFIEDKPKEHYTITQPVSYSDITEGSYLYNRLTSADIVGFNQGTTATDISMDKNAPGSRTLNRIRLAYGSIDFIGSEASPNSKYLNKIPPLSGTVNLNLIEEDIANETLTAADSAYEKYWKDATYDYANDPYPRDVTAYDYYKNRATLEPLYDQYTNTAGTGYKDKLNALNATTFSHESYEYLRDRYFIEPDDGSGRMLHVRDLEPVMKNGVQVGWKGHIYENNKEVTVDCDITEDASGGRTITYTKDGVTKTFKRKPEFDTMNQSLKQYFGKTGAASDDENEAWQNYVDAKKRAEDFENTYDVDTMRDVLSGGLIKSAVDIAKEYAPEVKKVLTIKYAIGADGTEGSKSPIRFKPVTTEQLEAANYDLSSNDLKNYPGTSEEESFDCFLNTDTGELIFKDELAETLKAERAMFSFTYDKTGFEKGNLTPENYFNCTDWTRGTDTDPDRYSFTHYEAGTGEWADQVDASGQTVSIYTAAKWQSQDINYTVAQNQEMAINIEGNAVVNQNLDRDIEELASVIQASIDAHDKLTTLTNMKSQDAYAGASDQAKLDALIEAAGKEIDYADNKMREVYTRYVGKFQDYITTVSLSKTDLGARGQRLELTKNRLSSQYSTVEKLKSENENEELSDIIIDYQSAYLAYQGSLQAAAKVQQQSLLDYI